MNLTTTVNQKQLLDILLNVGLVRPIIIWGAPGIGKSAIVEQFAEQVGLPCVSLLGSQLAPEDIIGVPQIVDGRSVFCPPRMIARDEPYCLFLDELNACSQEVQKAFYSLILERRVGEYHLPEGSIVVGAGNRAQDNAITRPMSSALLNRMFHVELRADARLWLEWTAQNGIFTSFEQSGIVRGAVDDPVDVHCVVLHLVDRHIGAGQHQLPKTPRRQHGVRMSLAHQRKIPQLSDGLLDALVDLAGGRDANLSDVKFDDLPKVLGRRREIDQLIPRRHGTAPPSPRPSPPVYIPAHL